MPTDGLSLAVLIGCQPHGVGLFDLTPEAVYKFLLLGRNLIFRFKGACIYAELLFLEITDMSVT